MLLRKRHQKYLRGRHGAILCLSFVLSAGLIVYARSSRLSQNAFALAEDLPRGAIVYAQFSDLPAFVKMWDESTLKQQYLDSANFKQFEQRHLALKLLARWQEFNDALGFELDMATISGATEKRAAIAVYDIGRLDMIFIAPLNEEQAAATKFFRSKDQFEGIELPDGTTYYSHNVEADKGRQKQQIAFAVQRGRFILATNEQLLRRALANINKRAQKDRLADDPSFKALSRAVVPHFATVWTDQARLNDDWYFKHYWAMQNVSQLKVIRAGMFDLELQAGQMLEHRDFLLSGQNPKRSNEISVRDAQRISALIPNDAPYSRIKAVDDNVLTASTTIQDTLFDRLSQDEESRGAHWQWQSYDGEDFSTSVEDEGDWEGNSYSYLEQSYDASIDDSVDAKVVDDKAVDNQSRKEAEQLFAVNLQKILQPAHPIVIATAESPRAMAAPLFADFRRISILTLREPAALDEQALAQAISRAAQSRLMIAGSTSNLKWLDKDINGQPVRELEMPMLGWTLCYALRGTELIFANSFDLLQESLTGQGNQGDEKLSLSAPVDDVTAIRFNHRQEVFDEVVNRLDSQRPKAISDVQMNAQSGSVALPEEFFSGNVTSLLNVASSVSKIVIERSSQQSRLHEEVEIVFASKM